MTTREERDGDLESKEVTILSHVWKVGHHVGNDLEAAVLGQLETFDDTSDGMTTKNHTEKACG